MIAWVEILVVVLSLVITLAIGMYFHRSGSASLQEYMLGNRKMTVLPISLSIAASYLTGSALVTSCQEIYMYGGQMSVASLNYAVYGILATAIYLPVSYNIQSVSSFEFFDRRFNRHVRKFASVLYALEAVLHTAVSQYVPSVALSQATGYSVFPIACVLSLICLLYTVSGGLKAVAWTDSFQAFVFMSCTITIFALGFFMIGGFSEIWRIGTEGSRMEFFVFSWSASTRYTYFNVAVGGYMVMVHNYLSPSFHQRVISMPTLRQAQQVVILSSIFAFVFIGFAFATGFVVYAYFAGCDPVLAKEINNYSKILPYFVNQITRTVPGIEGLFLSGVLAAGLSTTTSCWNTVACTVYADFIVPLSGQEISKKTSKRILMCIVVIVGVVSTTTIPLIENFNSLQELSMTLKSLTLSMHFTLYHTGMFLPWVNAKGAFIGSFVSGVVSCYAALGSQRAKTEKLIIDYPKILTTAKCLVNGTITMEALNKTMSSGSAEFGSKTFVDPSVPWLSSFSMLIYMVPGAVLGLIVALLASWLFGFEDLKKVNPNLITPLMRWVLPKPAKTQNTDETTTELISTKLETNNLKRTITQHIFD